jgi:1-acyl-sn-glycerol-3-phosphate acyltransferase
MANHQSNFDIFIVQAYIPYRLRWLAKKELFKIPVFGSAMERVGAIAIDRENRVSTIKSFDEAAQKIKEEGIPVATFSEGTRSKDSRIKPFKKGVFYMAIKSGVPVIPISIIGSGKIMSKRSLNVHPGKITMVIGKPIEVKDYSIESCDELVEKVRSVISRNYYNGKTIPEGKENF